jgi:hypothetical protein
MADNSAVGTYRSEGLTTSGWNRRRQAAEDQAEGPQVDLTTNAVHRDVALEGETPMGAGSGLGGSVQVEHHSRPARVRSEDRAATRAAQNPQSASEPHPRAARRGRNYVSPRGK